MMEVNEVKVNSMPENEMANKMLQRGFSNMFQGIHTASQVKRVNRTRAKNRVAKKSRRQNRGK